MFDILQHTAPQHRQYLSYDGVGMGSPAQRERQYQQSRASKAYGKVRRSPSILLFHKKIEEIIEF